MIATTLHCTALHCTALYYTTLHYTTLHYTTQHHTVLYLLVTVHALGAQQLEHRSEQKRTVNLLHQDLKDI